MQDTISNDCSSRYLLGWDGTCKRRLKILTGDWISTYEELELADHPGVVAAGELGAVQDSRYGHVAAAVALYGPSLELVGIARAPHVAALGNRHLVGLDQWKSWVVMPKMLGGS